MNVELLKRRVFISQPMNGISEQRIALHRAEAEKDIVNMLGWGEVVFVNSMIDDEPPEGANSGIWYLGRSLIILSMCDAVYFCPNWQMYKGCCIEHDVAIKYGLQILKE